MRGVSHSSLLSLSFSPIFQPSQGYPTACRTTKAPAPAQQAGRLSRLPRRRWLTRSCKFTSRRGQKIIKAASRRRTAHTEQQNLPSSEARRLNDASAPHLSLLNNRSPLFICSSIASLPLQRLRQSNDILSNDDCPRSFMDAI